ncbi:AraC family transcriptional regulator [Ralstonia solanacearum]|nr:AraC family transcriptional regulator [Ralstonia solanacearum]
MYGHEDPKNSEMSTTDILAQAIGKFAQSEGDHATAIPALTLHRRKAPTEPLHCIYGLGLGVVAQGGKQVTLGEKVVDYGPGQSMLTTIDLPVLAHVTHASLREPFLGMMLTLDARSIVQIASEMELPQPGKDCSCQPVTIERLDAALADALIRLVKLLDEPALAPRLAPLIQQEITVRLLTGPHGSQLRHLVTAGSPSQQIAKAVAWLKQNFAQPLHVDDLAARARMSPSTFRQHFRTITGMSPLQFQKQLRLQEARQLMLNQNLDAGHAGGLVGYESASQFNREYSRLFGAPPQRDIKRMRLS